jgi:hypothetical protein
MNELSNFQLMNLIKDKKLDYYFAGVYSNDLLPKELIRDKFYIINLQDHDAGSGTHWTVLYYNKPLTSIYFDSYGFPSPLDVENRIKPYIYNNKEIQDFDSSACGYYCIAFILFLHNKDNKQNAFKTFLSLFKLQTLKNDKILYNLLY